jgi:hypothetical protein
MITKEEAYEEINQMRELAAREDIDPAEKLNRSKKEWDRL